MKQDLPYLLIFTDLDGTLLDHHSYSAVPANALIRQLHERFPVQIIPVTSKTRAELDQMDALPMFRHALAIYENGSVIGGVDPSPFLEKEGPSSRILGVSYQAILDAIASLPPSLRTHIRGFQDMSTAEVTDATGLPLQNADAAKQREATEPFLWTGSDSEMSILNSKMAEAGIRIQQGGRFFHFTGEATKVDAVQLVVDTYRKKQVHAGYVTIALGDGPNDLTMIEAADYGVIMPNPDGVTIASDRPHIRIAPEPGPKGWVASIAEILDELGFNAPEI